MALVFRFVGRARKKFRANIMCKPPGGHFHGANGKSGGGTSQKNTSDQTVNNLTNKFPPNDSQIKHIFRPKEGHLSDTPENRKLIETVANDPANYKSKDKYGNEWYSRNESDGSQVWVITRNGRIQNSDKKMEETEMKRKYLHIVMFRAMDCLYDEMENPPEILDVFLTDANPYIWADHKTADPAIQSDFDKSMDKQNISDEVDESTAYNAVKNFLYEQNIHFAELFKDISFDEWKELCDIVTEEESQHSKSLYKIKSPAESLGGNFFIECLNFL